MDKVVLRNNHLYRETLDRIKALLMKKTILEKKPQNENNKTFIGGCSFWFKQDESTGTYYLLFDKDTSLWDMEFMRLELDAFEYNLSKYSIY